MQIDVGSYIAELLYEHDSMIVPGLGGFVTRYKAAEIDQVQGKIHPPSKDLHFNNNLVVNDGILINYIEKKHDLSYEEAEKAVADYVSQVKAAIDRREIVVFPQVGRLYKDYEQKLQFLPDNTNFNTEVYGLPDVEVTPLARLGTQPKSGAATPAVSQTAAAPVSNQIYEWFQRNLALISILSIVVVALGFYFLFFNDRTKAAEDEKSVPTSRLNVSPARPSGDSADLAQADTVAATAPQTPAEPSPETEGATLAPDQQFCVIRIGYFGNADNVERLVQDIFEAGFEPYTEPSGKLTLVGVQFPYETQAEIDRTLAEIRDRFEPKAKVIRK